MRVFTLEKAVGSTDCTDSTDLKQVGKGCRFIRRVKWKLRSGEASCPSPSVKSVKSVDNPTAAFRFTTTVATGAKGETLVGRVSSRAVGESQVSRFKFEGRWGASNLKLKTSNSDAARRSLAPPHPFGRCYRCYRCCERGACRFTKEVGREAF